MLLSGLRRPGWRGVSDKAESRPEDEGRKADGGVKSGLLSGAKYTSSSRGSMVRSFSAARRSSELLRSDMSVWLRFMSERSYGLEVSCNPGKTYWMDVAGE